MTREENAAARRVPVNADSVARREMSYVLGAVLRMNNLRVRFPSSREADPRWQSANRPRRQAIGVTDREPLTRQAGVEILNSLNMRSESRKRR